MNEAFQPIECAAVVHEHQTLYAPRYDDHYYASDAASADGVAETDYVFIEGNHLAERFRQLPEHGFFVIGETGFGSGLNFLRAALCFLEHAPASSRLFFYSSEKHPLPAAVFDAIQQQRAWIPPVLLHAFQTCPIPATPGFHTRQIAEGRIHLCLMYGDSNALWPLARAHCDAWFLDGFAPSKNPDMWQADLFRALADHSKAGTTLATFTAAGFVRRALQQAGFQVERKKGFGHKREMLIAEFPDQWEPSGLKPRHVAVIGAGLAGCTTARALAEFGCTVTLYDGQGLAQGASGNLAGVLYTSASPHFTAQNRFYQSSFFHALAWMQRLGFPADAEQGALNGVWHVPTHASLMERTRQALIAGYWPEEELSCGEYDGQQGACFTRAGYISPPLWCQHLIKHPDIHLVEQQVQAVQAIQAGWQVLSEALVASFDDVVLCTSHETPQLLDTGFARLRRVRGQVSLVQATESSKEWQQAACHQGYLTPALGGLHAVGATFNRQDESTIPFPEEDAANIAALQDALPRHWQALGGEQLRIADSRVSMRCYSPDSLPLAGAAVDANGDRIPGLWLSVGHGGRGITHTPLCADLIAADMLALPLPCDQLLQEALSPARFHLRAERKQRK